MPFGYVYKISSPNTQQIYIGSTTSKHISLRKSKHVYDYKGYLNGTRHYRTSFELLKHGDCVFDMLERVEYNHVSELRQREAEIMRNHTNTVNKYPAGLRPAEPEPVIQYPPTTVVFD
jgi:hypothetical protein